MGTKETDLNNCTACGAKLIRNRRNQKITLTGVNTPSNALYADLPVVLKAVWCPRCGLPAYIKSAG